MVSLDGQEMGSLEGPDTYALLGDDYGYLTIAAATGGRTNEHRVDSLTFQGTFEGEVPLVSIAAPADQLEGAAGESGELVFVATLSEAAAADVIASVTVTGAVGPTSVTIPAGATSAEIVVSYFGNDAYDGDAAVTVQLTGALNANLGESLAATATILDDDTPETRDLIGDMVLNGHAELMGDGIRLTPDSGSKKGVAATESRIDFTKDFEIEASVYLGESNGGADGLGFAFHNDARGAAASGDGGGDMGVIGIRDGFGFELDTHRGRGDIGDDHFNFLNVENGNRLSGQYDLNNIEDDQNHDLLIQWDANEGMMQLYFDGALVGTADADDTIDLMGDTAGYMSIGAATGGRANEHRIDDLVFTGAFVDDLIF